MLSNSFCQYIDTRRTLCILAFSFLATAFAGCSGPQVGTVQLTPEGGRAVLGKVELIVPEGALARPLKVEIRHVSPRDLPPLAPGMVNVTEGRAGYRFLPSGNHFSKTAQVRIPLDLTPGLAALWQTLGAKTFYWEEKTERWVPLDSSSVDRGGKRVISHTGHFTLMINAVVKSPDQTAPTAFDANTIKDIGIAAPTANVDLIEPPKANNRGDAQLTFPIRLPAGRGAFSPSLQLTYSSSAGDGPIGVGWQLPVSRIEVDTRWGVPRYDGTERYLLDGQALVPVAPEDSPLPVDPGACHKGERQGMYATRIQGFKRIYLCDDPADAEPPHWEVTEPNGTRFEYGTDDESRLASYRPGESTHIARWALRSVVDVNGNVTAYRYWIDSDEHVAGYNGEPFRAQYLSAVEYTRFERTLSRHYDPDLSQQELAALTPIALDPQYRVDFDWDCAEADGVGRSDTPTSGRNGFLTLTRCRLDEIFVRRGLLLAGHDDASCDDDQDPTASKIRCYKLDYEESYDFKSLLARIEVYGRDGSKFYDHEFDYTQPEFIEQLASDQVPRLFAAPERWDVSLSASELPQVFPLNAATSLLEDTEEESHQGGVGMGASLRVGGEGAASFGCSSGWSATGSYRDPHPQSRLVDINGDRVVDRVYLLGNSIRAVLGRKGESGHCFGEDCATAVSGGVKSVEPAEMNEVGDEVALDGGFGYSVDCDLVRTDSYAGNVGVQLSLTESLLADADGDGYLDLLLPNGYYRGLPRVCRDGSAPADGVCADGIEICTGENTLCFTYIGEETLQRSAAAVRATNTASSDPTLTVHAAAPSLVPPADPPSTARAAISTSRTDETDCREAEGFQSCLGPMEIRPTSELRNAPQDEWGQDHALTTRMQLDSLQLDEGEPMRTVIRWDVPMTGTIVDPKVRLSRTLILVANP